MLSIGQKILVKEDNSYTASTDMGDIAFFPSKSPLWSWLIIGSVSYKVPSFHGAFPIPTDEGVSLHHPRFADHAGSDSAHEAAIKCGKGMAMLTIRLLTNPWLVEAARKDFDELVEVWILLRLEKTSLALSTVCKSVVFFTYSFLTLVKCRYGDPFATQILVEALLEVTRKCCSPLQGRTKASLGVTFPEQRFLRASFSQGMVTQSVISPWGDANFSSGSQHIVRMNNGRSFK